MSVQLKVVYDREWDEWQVRWYENGRWDEDKTYFGGGKHDEDAEGDALSTARMMAQEAYDKGYRDVEVLT